MSKRRDLERRIHGLGEIKEIMNAMKNLALMETHKLTRFLATQHRVVEDIRAAAEDFLSFHAQFFSENKITRDVFLLIGSERGFCGDFNDAMRRYLNGHSPGIGAPALIVVGSKLSSKLADDRRVVMQVEGPATLEEVQPVLRKLVEALGHWQAMQAAPCLLRLTVFHNQPGDAGVKTTLLNPFTHWAAQKPRPGHAPLLNLDPRVFLTQLADHYLFATLHEIFYSSLMAENQRRIQHMDSAVRRIEQKSSEFQRKRNSLHQEEITEEIEVIMLNAEMMRT
ncbi:MAG TPA: FoF1 ATP synthase subunit gamma [Gammaproteobacteria bacterium]|nr:FoF1 ATP synthase subunit gamma [Gammaproteobacteria bacterium]